MGIRARLIMRQNLCRCQDIVGVNRDFVNVAFIWVTAEAGLGVVGTDREIGRSTPVFGRIYIGRIKRRAVRSHRDAVNICRQNSRPLIIAVATRIAVVGLRLPRKDQMLPLADCIVSTSENVLAAGPLAAIHAEIPAMTFAGRICEVGVALENYPTGP